MQHWEEGHPSHFRKKITLFFYFHWIPIYSQLCCVNKQSPNLGGSQKQMFTSCSSYMPAFVGQLQLLGLCLALLDSAPFVFLSQPLYGTWHFHSIGRARKLVETSDISYSFCSAVANNLSSHRSLAKASLRAKTDVKKAGKCLTSTKRMVVGWDTEPSHRETIIQPTLCCCWLLVWKSLALIHIDNVKNYASSSG